MEFDVVIIGHITIDVNVFPRGIIENMLGGAPTYAGFMLASLGEKVGIVSKIGEDFPDKFPPLYGKFGLDTEGVYSIPEKTTIFENTYDELGGRKQTCWLLPSKISPEEIPGAYFHTRSFYVSPVGDEVTPGVLETVKKKENVVMLDPQGLFRKVGRDGKISVQKPENLDDYLVHVDVVKIGPEEFQAFAKSPEETLRELVGAGPKVAILTRGEKGCMVLCDGKFGEFEGLKVDVKDLTGAGDVFGAAFLVRYLNTRDVADSAKFATATASLKIKYKGPSGFPTEEEILGALGSQ